MTLQVQPLGVVFYQNQPVEFDCGIGCLVMASSLAQ